MQSWAMFAVKVTELAGVKEKWQQQRELETEIRIERMVSQLESASPEIALEVEEKMLTSSLANQLINDEDVEKIRKRVSMRRSTVHHSTESKAPVTLDSISPGGSLPARSSS